MSSGKLKPVPWLGQTVADKPYYDRSYAEQLHPRTTNPQKFDEKVAAGIVAVVAALNYAYAYSPGWLLENNLLNGKGMREHTKQTLWFRRLMPMEAFLSLPVGMAAWLLSHVYAGFGERAVEGMSMPMMVGYNVHMAHMNSFFETTRPFLLGRLTYILWQILAVPFLMAFTVISPHMTFLVAMYMAEWLGRLYSEFLQDIDKGHANQLQHTPAPEAAKKSYNLPEHATFRDAVLAMRADEVFMAELLSKAVGHKDDPMKH